MICGWEVTTCMSSAAALSLALACNPTHCLIASQASSSPSYFCPLKMGCCQLTPFVRKPPCPTTAQASRQYPSKDGVRTVTFLPGHQRPIFILGHLCLRVLLECANVNISVKVPPCARTTPLSEQHEVLFLQVLDRALPARPEHSQRMSVHPLQERACVRSGNESCIDRWLRRLCKTFWGGILPAVAGWRTRAATHIGSQ
mmetsp:Transcript_36513/g.59678  ORF Transcript_36513/g.59678 Transcript_36513/m.59678 type:complete len:200 (+) Transcript_36513:287-886(+)